MDLEERLRGKEAATSDGPTPTRSGFTSASTDAGADISDKIGMYLNSAYTAAIGTYDTDPERYETMSKNINQAKKAAEEQGVDFNRLFGMKVTEIVGRYVNSVLSGFGVNHYLMQLNESIFTSMVDNAVKAAEDFRETMRFRPEIERVVRAFVDGAIEMGKRSSFSPTSYLDMAIRVGARYEVSVNIPDR